MWRKDGKVYTGGGIIVRNAKGIDIWWSKPTDAQFLAAGWNWQEPEPVPEDPAFAAVKAAFWGYVDAAAAALSEATGQTYARADFPIGAYSSELLAWCIQHGMTETMTGDLAVKFCGIAADLARLGRNWNELFDEAR